MPSINKNYCAHTQADLVMFSRTGAPQKVSPHIPENVAQQRYILWSVIIRLWRVQHLNFHLVLHYIIWPRWRNLELYDVLT